MTKSNCFIHPSYYGVQSELLVLLTLPWAFPGILSSGLWSCVKFATNHLSMAPLITMQKHQTFLLRKWPLFLDIIIWHWYLYLEKIKLTTWSNGMCFKITNRKYFSNFIQQALYADGQSQNHPKYNIYNRNSSMYCSIYRRCKMCLYILKFS